MMSAVVEACAAAMEAGSTQGMADLRRTTLRPLVLPALATSGEAVLVSRSSTSMWMKHMPTAIFQSDLTKTFVSSLAWGGADLVHPAAEPAGEDAAGKYYVPHKVGYEVHRLVINQDPKFTNFVECLALP